MYPPGHLAGSSEDTRAHGEIPPGGSGGTGQGTAERPKASQQGARTALRPPVQLLLEVFSNSRLTAQRLGAERSFQLSQRTEDKKLELGT